MVGQSFRFSTSSLPLRDFKATTGASLLCLLPPHIPVDWVSNSCLLYVALSNNYGCSLRSRVCSFLLFQLCSNSNFNLVFFYFCTEIFKYGYIIASLFRFKYDYIPLVVDFVAFSYLDICSPFSKDIYCALLLDVKLYL